MQEAGAKLNVKQHSAAQLLGHVQGKQINVYKSWFLIDVCDIWFNKSFNTFDKIITVSDDDEGNKLIQMRLDCSSEVDQ